MFEELNIVQSVDVEEDVKNRNDNEFNAPEMKEAQETYMNYLKKEFKETKKIGLASFAFYYISTMRNTTS